MIVNHQLKFVFVAVPRTGSVSMTETLRKLPGSRVLILGGRHRNSIPLKGRDYFTFACVRNPYAREYSHFRYRQKNKPASALKRRVQKMTFQEYVVCHTQQPQRLKMGDPPMSEFLADIRLDMLLRFEDLPNCFQQLPFLPAGVWLPHRNAVTAGEDWRLAYDARLARLLYDWAKRDFETFHYHPEAWRHASYGPQVAVQPAA